LGAPDGQSACFDIGATCLSFIVALHHVAHLVAAGVYERALIFSSEVVGHSLNFDEPESASLLGDAAAAAIVTRTPPGQISALHHAAFATHSAAGADLTRFLGGGNRRHPNDPQTTPAMNRFEMRGPDVFRLASRVFPPFLDRFFDGLGWKREEFCAAVPHQASGPALRYLSARAGFRPDQVVVNLPCRGNCVAASIPLALAEAVHAGRIRRGERVLLAGTGAGLTLGALALTF
jgi:3-oxoacyl-[acyl-carrier-protein] synthase-3